MRLAMTYLSTIPNLRLILKHRNLLISPLLEDGSLDFSTIKHRLAYCDFPTISDHQDLIQFDRTPFISRKLFHIDNLAW